MPDQKVDFSLIIPIYKAEIFLPKVLKTIDEHFWQRKELWELILVNDASPDTSQKICEEFLKKEKPYQVILLNHEKNQGKGAAIKRGMLKARGTHRIFMDCDLAYPLSEVFKMAESLQAGNDVVIASRVHPESLYTISMRDFHYLYTRHVASRLFNWVVEKLLIPKIQDTQAGLKGFAGQAAEKLFGNLKIDRFGFDLEILRMAYENRLKLAEIPVHFNYREELSTVDFLMDGLRLLFDICLIRFRSLGRKYQLFEERIP